MRERYQYWYRLGEDSNCSYIFGGQVNTHTRTSNVYIKPSNQSRTVYFLWRNINSNKRSPRTPEPKHEAQKSGLALAESTREA